jgi:hypothetical protein
MSLHDSLEKINSVKKFLSSEKGKDILVIIIVILVGLGSFELGRLSMENGGGNIKIENQGPNSSQDNNSVEPEDSTQTSLNGTTVGYSTPTSESPAGKTFFASSRGSKYYTIDCSAGKNIKSENKVWFATGEEAEAAGYTLSSACQ